MRAVIFGLAVLWTSASQAQSLNDVSWLEGCWRLSDERGEITEIWQSPPVPALLGYGATTRDGETTSWKQARIEVVGDDLVFFFMPSGRGPTAFAWSEMRQRDGVADTGFVAFSNPHPRFPQNVSYEREGARLTLRLSGPRRREEVYAFERIECPEEYRQ